VTALSRRLERVKDITARALSPFERWLERARAVTNTGDVALRVLAVYVNESLAWSGALDLAPGANSLLTVNAPCGSRYLVKVCSARGNCWSFLEEEAWGG